jgi:hypothetical protein
MRPFSYPEVAALEIGGSCFVNAPVSEVKRKCALYAARNGKRFEVFNQSNETYPPCALVRRLPVTDAELPSAA